MYSSRSKSHKKIFTSSVVVPVVPEEEPLAGLLHVGLSVAGEDLRHLRLDLPQRHLAACLSTVS